MPNPLMGFALQSIVPPTQPYAVSDAVPLLTFPRTADPHDPLTLQRDSEEPSRCENQP
jgi:hypothetical protein